MVHDLVNFSFQLAAFTIIFFVLGMIKPKWPLFFMKEPSRFIILMITPILIMISVTMYGEGIKREKEAKALTEKSATTSVPAPTPAPVPVPATDAPAGTPASN